ncbi:MAG: DUF2029 domain-containing protein [Micrococcales bacterium]|nr:DUF2029 domain-containing protein [Micrococcales bacterium]
MRRWNLVVDAVLVLACAAAAALLTQDANWDQLQYHYWYPWQLFHGGFSDPDLYGGRFQNPLPQVPFYLLATALPPMAAQTLLGALAGVVAVITRRVAARVLPLTGGWLLAASTTAAVLGMVGAGFRSEVGTSYSDVLLAGLLLGGLLLVLREQPLLAGVLAGAAAGLKYTGVPFSVAMLVAVLVVRWRGAGWWLLGALGGWLLTGAWWAWSLWRTYQSPVFPFWNSVFASPWYPSADLTDERYGVAGLRGWLLWPWDMATGDARVLDLPVRDPRWLLLVAAIVLILLAARRLTRAGIAVLVFTLTGTFVWLALFGVIRYAIPAEMLVGVLVVWALTLWVSPRVALAVGLLITVLAGTWTQSAQSRRVPFGDRWYEVEAGAFAAVAPGDVVLVDGQYPSTFLLPQALTAGVAVHVVQKDFTGTPLQGWLERDLDGASRVWVVTGRPPSQVDPAIGTIDYENCSRIRSNVVDRWLCPLTL